MSGYIDFAHRLRTENMEGLFEGKRRLIPKPTDLSYYNWFTKTSAANPTADFQILADDELGLLFKNKHDRKIINVDPWTDPGDAATRTELETSEYIQARPVGPRTVCGANFLSGKRTSGRPCKMSCA